ncbi:TPM domain-containing protein [Paenibacillus fonticola]|uniref:TPM domain-containing protein n=1 Tax=Paenibacillus fonticola TaxID=379896 RepID=UPI000361D9EA|nr:TPM domain-containing protein [Paenibacillus fonticola]
MRRHYSLLSVLIFLAVYLAVPGGIAAAAETKTLIYDEANLLSPGEYDELNAMANEYGAKRETDIIIITSNNPENIDVVKMTEDFYDDRAPGYDKPHGNAVILTLDMNNRDVYLAGFYKAEQYLDDGRLAQIRNKITPNVSSGDYKLAFEKYIKTAHKYMGFKPGVNPDNPLFNIGFQLIAALVVGGIVVGIMAYRSGGRITVNRRTYEDASTSGIVGRQDQYLRTTTTKRKIERNTGGGSGGRGGGGITSGGHSHSGSRGKF